MRQEMNRNRFSLESGMTLRNQRTKRAPGNSSAMSTSGLIAMAHIHGSITGV